MFFGGLKGAIAVCIKTTLQETTCKIDLEIFLQDSSDHWKTSICQSRILRIPTLTFAV